ncbi:unnamed protein product [Arctogadus glacialis]
MYKEADVTRQMYQLYQEIITGAWPKGRENKRDLFRPTSGTKSPLCFPSSKLCPWHCKHGTAVFYIMTNGEVGCDVRRTVVFP